MLPGRVDHSMRSGRGVPRSDPTETRLLRFIHNLVPLKTIILPVKLCKLLLLNMLLVLSPKKILFRKAKSHRVWEEALKLEFFTNHFTLHYLFVYL